MYQLAGSEFSDLFNREFTKDPVSIASSGSVNNVFSCHSKNSRSADFDLLKFSGTFQQDIRVNDFQDTSHVSMHFQLAGRSNASISGLDNYQPMQCGQFNILNCVTPLSSFTFPKQNKYEYLCLGLRPSFFNEVLNECGPAYAGLLDQSLKGNPFTLFNSAVAVHQHQFDILQLIQNPPVADTLKTNYTRSKLKELIFLSLDTSPKKDKINSADVEKLYQVREFLTDQYLSDQSMNTICRNFMLNEFKLKKGFKELFGITVFGYIHKLRMIYAYELLAGGGLRTGEIASIVGYTSDSSFIRAFKSFHGYSPQKLTFTLPSIVS